MNQGNGLYADYSPADATRHCYDCEQVVPAEDCDEKGRCVDCQPESGICCRCLGDADAGSWDDGCGNVLCGSCNEIIHRAPEWFEYGGEG